MPAKSEARCAFAPEEMIKITLELPDAQPSSEFKKLIGDIINHYLFTPYNAYPHGKGMEVKFLSHFIQMQNATYWNDALTSSYSNRNFFQAIGVTLVKGLPLDVDFGFTYMKNLDFCDQTFMWSLSWAPIPGWESLYAFSVRTDFFYLYGNGFYFAYGTNIGATISKRIGRFTPYAGVIITFTKAFSASYYRKYLGAPFIFSGKGTIGLNYNLSFIQIGMQFSISSLVSYTLTVGGRF